MPLRPSFRTLRSARLLPSLRLYSTSPLPTTLPNNPLFRALKRHDPSTPAVSHALTGTTYTYGQLLHDVLGFSRLLAERNALDEESGGLEGKRVGILAEAGYPFVVSLLGTWAAKGIAVPLCKEHPPKEIQYVLEDSESSVLVSSKKYHHLLAGMVKGSAKEDSKFPVQRWLEMENFHVKGEGEKDWALPFYTEDDKDAMILYTSGTTNLPKGVLTTHEILEAQAMALVEAWKITKEDKLLHILPLHHTHGILNGTLAPLYAGAHISYLSPWTPQKVWETLAEPYLSPAGEAAISSVFEPKPIDPDAEVEPLEVPGEFTLFTAVPTIYSRLITSHSTLTPDLQRTTSAAANRLRLAMSGSAALPLPTRNKWNQISKGNLLLERFGMTELGMALSCGLDPSERIDNSVGRALPGYEVRLGDVEDPNTAIPLSETNTSGEIQVKGKGVFKGYWNRPQAVTAKEFTSDGFFRTGDVAVRDEQGNFFIQGRQSQDIIKSGGEKISALEIEREILSLPGIAEVAVLGVPSEEWGEEVAALVVFEDGKSKGDAFKMIRKGLKTKGLAKWKVPKVVRVVKGGLPRNQMGKVNKKNLRKLYFEEGEKKESAK